MRLTKISLLEGRHVKTDFLAQCQPCNDQAMILSEPNSRAQLAALLRFSSVNERETLARVECTTSFCKASSIRKGSHSLPVQLHDALAVH